MRCGQDPHRAADHPSLGRTRIVVAGACSDSSYHRCLPGGRAQRDRHGRGYGRCGSQGLAVGNGRLPHLNLGAFMWFDPGGFDMSCGSIRLGVRAGRWRDQLPGPSRLPRPNPASAGREAKPPAIALVRHLPSQSGEAGFRRAGPGQGAPVPGVAAPKPGEPADPLAAGRVRAAASHADGPSARR